MKTSSAGRNKASTANPALAAGLRELARSSAAGTHQNKQDRRRRTRAAKKRSALDDQI